MLGASPRAGRLLAVTEKDQRLDAGPRGLGLAGASRRGETRKPARAAATIAFLPLIPTFLPSVRLVSLRLGSVHLQIL